MTKARDVADLGGGVSTADIIDANVTQAKLAANSVNSDQYVDGSIDTAHIADVNVTQAKLAAETVNEAKMQVSNAPTNGYMLTAQSGNTGGLTWAAAPTSSTTYAAVGTYGYFITTGTVYSITAGSTTRSGGSLRPHAVTVYTLSASYTGNHHWPSPGSSPNVGTWRAMGGTGGNWAGSAKYTATLYIRIS